MADTNYPSASNQPVNRPNNTTRNVLIGLLAVALLGTWGYVLYDKNKTQETIQVKSAEITSATSARDSVQSIYNESLARLDSLVGSNNALTGKLTERQTEIVKLKNQINSIMRNKNATADDLTKAR